MPLYKPSNTAELAQSAMNGATQAAAAQTKQTGTKTEKESNFWDDLNKGAAAVAYVGRGMEGLTDAAKKATDLYDQYQKRDAYDEIDKAYASGGIDAIQGMGTKNYHYAQALGQFFTDRGNSEKGRSEMLKAAEDRAIQEYASWKPQAIAVKRAYDSGNMQQFMPLMQQLSAQSPFPYKLIPNSDGNFDVMFRSDKDLGFVKTDTITPNAAVAEMTRILNGEQTVLMGINGELKPVNPIYNRGAILNRINTDMQNALNRTDVKRQVPLYDSKGDPAGLAIIQNPLDNYSVGPMLETYKGGKYIGTFDGYQGALQAGLTPFKKDKGKGHGDGSSGANSGYSLTQGDISLFQKYFTSKNAEGENVTDHGGSAFLEQFVRDKGLSPLQAIAAYDENKKRAIAAGAPPELADRIVQTEMAKDMYGGNRGQASQPQSTPINAPAVQPLAPPTKVQRRIQGIFGPEMPSGQQPQSQQPPQQPRDSAPATSPSLPMAGLNLKGNLTSYSKNGVTQWAVIGPDGQPQEITPEQAQEYGRQIDITARQERQAEGQRNMERMWGGNSHHGGRVTARDVWNELSEEEKSNWRSTGNLPGRYNQVR